MELLAPCICTLKASDPPFVETFMAVAIVRLFAKSTVWLLAVSVIVSVSTLTVDEKFTPAWLLVIVNSPLPEPTAPIVASPPALAIVNPPEVSAIDVRLMVAPEVEPEFSVKPNPAAVTAPTLRIAAALLPVLMIVASPNAATPISSLVLVVAMVPANVAPEGLLELPIVARPPTNVVMPPA